MAYKRSTNKAFAAQLEAAGYFKKIGVPVTMTIDESGDFTMLDTKGSEVFHGMGTVTTRRASHVLPSGIVKRQAFRLLRTFFGDAGKVSDWTRGWSGEWIVDTTPTAGVVLDRQYRSRQDAIDAEVEFLNNFFLTGERA